MFRRILLSITLFACAGAVPHPRSACLPPDEEAIELRGFLRELVTSMDTARTSLRATLGFPAMDSTKVVIVADNRICHNVARGYNTFLKTPHLVRELHVVSVGRFYAAKDPGHPAGEWVPTVSFDSKYKALNALLSP